MARGRKHNDFELHKLVDILIRAWLGEGYKTIAIDHGYLSPNYIALIARRYGVQRYKRRYLNDKGKVAGRTSIHARRLYTKRDGITAAQAGIPS